jgi:hypothetical protein
MLNFNFLRVIPKKVASWHVNGQCCGSIRYIYIYIFFYPDPSLHLISVLDPGYLLNMPFFKPNFSWSLKVPILF